MGYHQLPYFQTKTQIFVPWNHSFWGGFFMIFEGICLPFPETHMENSALRYFNKGRWSALNNHRFIGGRMVDTIPAGFSYAKI